MALLHRSLGSNSIGKVTLFRVYFFGRDLWLFPIKAPSVIGASGFAIATANAPVVINDDDPVFFLPGCFDRANRNAGRVVTLLALDRHIKLVDLRNGVIVGAIAVFQIQRALLHFKDANVRLIRAAMMIVLFVARLHAFSVAIALAQVDGVAEFHTRNGAMKLIKRVRVTKAFLVLMTLLFTNNGLHPIAAAHGIKVSVVEPGAVSSDFVANAGDSVAERMNNVDAYSPQVQNYVERTSGACLLTLNPMRRRFSFFNGLDLLEPLQKNNR